jgi:hypothetical protein
VIAMMYTAMKTLPLPFVLLFALTMPATLSYAQSDLTSVQMIEGILSERAHRDELKRINIGITTILADDRLTDQSARQLLQQSQAVLNEMLNHKDGTNVEKLVEFVKWLRAQGEDQISISDTGATTPQRQFVRDNPLAGQEVYLTSIVHWVLAEYVRIDRAGAGTSKLEGYLQIYLHFRRMVEGGDGIPNGLLFEAPDWIHSRFQQLTVDQKRQFLKDVQEAREESVLPPLPDEVPGEPRTPQEQAAYEAAYQFIVNNTPPP